MVSQSSKAEMNKACDVGNELLEDWPASNESGGFFPSNDKESVSLDQSKVEKRVQFSPKSKLRLYLPDYENKEQLFLTKEDRIMIKKRAFKTITAIREVLKNYSDECGYGSERFVMGEDEIVIALKSWHNEYGIQAEELIGIENMVHGREFAQSLDERRRVINKTIVDEWNERESKGDDYEKIAEYIAKLSKRLSTHATMRARHRANYIYSMDDSPEGGSVTRSASTTTFNVVFNDNKSLASGIANEHTHSSCNRSKYELNTGEKIKTQQERRRLVQMYNKAIMQSQ